MSSEDKDVDKIASEYFDEILRIDDIKKVAGLCAKMVVIRGSLRGDTKFGYDEDHFFFYDDNWNIRDVVTGRAVVRTALQPPILPVNSSGQAFRIAVSFTEALGADGAYALYKTLIRNA